MTEIMEWYTIDQDPEEPGWYATVDIRENKKTVPRYFDDYDLSWSMYSNHHDNQTMVPNNHFTHWTFLPKWDEAK